jgi:hypothetical protein
MSFSSSQSSTVSSQNSFAIPEDQQLHYATTSPWLFVKNEGLRRASSEGAMHPPMAKQTSETSTLYEPESSAESFAKMMSFGLADPYKDVTSPRGMAKKTADILNELRADKQGEQLKWSSRLHRIAMKQAAAVAKADRKLVAPLSNTRKMAEHVLPANYKIGNLDELVHMTHTFPGTGCAHEVAEKWLRETFRDNFEVIGVGCAQAAGGRWIFVAVVVTPTTTTEWKHQFYSVERLGTHPADEVFWTQTVV